MESPLVSICLPTYNGERYLEESLNSILLQTYKNFEVIISDDSSKDNTVQICNKFKEQAPFPVYIYSHKPQGIGANWNHCIEKANGTWIKLLFQDDIMEPDCIEKMLSSALKYHLDCIICKRKIIDSYSNKITSGDWYDNYYDLQKPAGIPTNLFFILSKKNINKFIYARYSIDNIIGEPCTSLFSIKLFRKTGPYNNKLAQLLDYEYWIRVLKHFEIGIMPEKLISFRVHEMQTSNINSKKGISENNLLKNILFKNLFFYIDKKGRGDLLKHKYPLYKKLFNLKYKI